MANERSNAVAATEERELVTSRVFAAPRDMVWAAFADPWQIGQWWGPTGFTTTITEMDLRAGGRWKLTLHGPDGTNYPNEMVFLEVVPAERVVLRLTGGKEGAPVIQFLQTITFADEDEGTRFTVRITYDSAEEREKNLREYSAAEGAQQMFARLEQHLTERKANPIEKLAGAPAQHELRITREFNAPRDLVWRAWTDPELMLQWSGPKQFPARQVKRGTKPGDPWRICLGGFQPGTEIPVEIWQGGVLKEIDPPRLLVYTYAWEKRSDVGLPDDGEPHQTVITVRLEKHDGKTTMHFHQAFFATASERDGHNGGWSSSFERLEELMNDLAVAQSTR